MGAKKKKIKAAGRFGSGYGTKPRANFNAVESRQRIKQQSPFCPNGKAKRIASGIWKCKRTGKVFAAGAYFLEKPAQ